MGPRHWVRSNVDQDTMAEVVIGKIIRFAPLAVEIGRRITLVVLNIDAQYVVLEFCYTG